MKIAITGAAGLIGSSLAQELDQDHEIVRIDLEPPAIVSLSVGWQEILETNIIGTQNVFEAARAAGVKRVIFASSNHAVGMREREGGAALYAPASGVLVRDDEPYCPDSWYGVGKAFGEVLGRYYSDEFGLQVTCIRIGSIMQGDSPTDPRLGVPAWLPHGVGDNATRFWDLEPGRAIFGFWPLDGTGKN